MNKALEAAAVLGLFTVAWVLFSGGGLVEWLMFFLLGIGLVVMSE